MGGETSTSMLFILLRFSLLLPEKRSLGSSCLILDPLPLLHSRLPLHCSGKEGGRGGDHYICSLVVIFVSVQWKYIHLLLLLILFLFFLFFLLWRFSFPKDVFRAGIAKMPWVLYHTKYCIVLLNFEMSTINTSLKKKLALTPHS